MKKTLFITCLAASALFIGSCGHKEGKRPWDKDKDSVESAESSAPQEVKMEEIATEETVAPMDDIDSYKGNANYRKLMLIAAKCDDPNFTLEDLSQSDYTFMINFCNMMMDSAEEADAQGVSEEWMEEYKDFQDLLQGFSLLLSSAYSENMLDSNNSHDYELMMRRATRMADYN